MSTTKKYWKGLEELTQDADFVKKSQNEFSEELPVEFLGKDNLAETSTKRRDFLKFLGFSVTAASLAACETPVQKVIPYVVKPEDVTAGVANWYASTFYDGNDYANILVKTREGRPIHIEGNKLSALTNGTNARVNSSVLSLYDDNRLKQPTKAGSATSWNVVDKEITDKLAKAGSIRILTSTIISPSTKAVIQKFAAKYNDVKHITLDAVSYYGMRKANEQSFGKAAIPSYNFSKAKVIVSLDADFLANWILPLQFANEYIKNKNPKGAWMNKHFQFEANLSLTGSNADVRVPVLPSQLGKIAANLLSAVGGAGSSNGLDTATEAKVKEAAKALLSAKGASLVVSGSNDVAVQTLVNAINAKLNNYSSTINLNKEVHLFQGNDEDVAELIKEMKSGKVDALLTYNVNPTYTLPANSGFASAYSKVKTKISFADRADETATSADYICPDSHYLESWNDANPIDGEYSVQQPTIRPLFNTRQFQSSLLTWAGADADYYAFLKSNFTSVSGASWNQSVHDGFVSKESAAASSVNFIGDASVAIANVAKAKTGDFEVTIYQKAGMGTGSQANNPWLQELPDPITKVTWDNYVTMSPAQMKEMGLNIIIGEQSPASVVNVTINGQTITLPAFPQPGQKRGTIGIAVGYGRTGIGKTAEGIGVNVFNLTSVFNGSVSYITTATVKATGGEYPIASTQTHHTLMGRDMINATTLNEFKKDNKAGNPAKLLTVHDAETGGSKKVPVTSVDLWNQAGEHPIDQGHRWGLSIDLNSCIGCSSCITACSSENNVPVVGKDEVRRSREMHWMRIDRYYSSDMNEEKAAEEGISTISMYSQMEIPSENPTVDFQPLMCQHCNHAPCETVCPVAATTHSNEGLNQMTYNRCVGTRYCANNCPFKVRRFNWFDYVNNNHREFTELNPAQNDLGRMVLNPDVVVRSRGVMEKCSMCVQRIQGGKLEAKKAGKKVEDGAIQTACASACPTNAISFGDLNDKNSKASKDAKDDRAYVLLEEINVQPNVFYQTKVKNA
jgi:molybdopterin-containing oxidoreductase family iron-sulfur binding subunit